MALHVVTVYLPQAANQLFSQLEGKCGVYADLVRRPHLTVANPFVPKVPISSIIQNLREVASKIAPFTLRCEGISYFEDWNNCAYVPVHHEPHIVNLHIAVYDSIGNLVDDKYHGKLNLDKYVPHVSIAVNIADDSLPHVKHALMGHLISFKIPVGSFELCAELGDHTWETLEIFSLTGTPSAIVRQLLEQEPPMNDEKRHSQKQSVTISHQKHQ